MRGQNDGAAARLRLSKRKQRLLTFLAVQICVELVDQQHRGLGIQRTRQLQQALFRRLQLRNCPVKRKMKAIALEKPFDILPEAARMEQTVRLRGLADVEIIQNGQILKQLEGLSAIGDLQLHRAEGRHVNRLTLTEQRTAGRRVKAAQQAQKIGLAGAVCAQDQIKPAGENGQADILEQRDFVADETDIAKLQIRLFRAAHNEAPPPTEEARIS